MKIYKYLFNYFMYLIFSNHITFHYLHYFVLIFYFVISFDFIINFLLITFVYQFSLFSLDFLKLFIYFIHYFTIHLSINHKFIIFIIMLIIKINPNFLHNYLIIFFNFQLFIHILNFIFLHLIILRKFVCFLFFFLKNKTY